MQKLKTQDKRSPTKKREETSYAVAPDVSGGTPNKALDSTMPELKKEIKN